jgi:predicted SAM-dependent methyltransferase
MKLNIGCGKDYKEGFVNIDGNENLKADYHIDIDKFDLAKYLGENKLDEIYAKDIIEHFTHWKAVELLKQFYKMLKPNGLLTIITPDFQTIIESEKPIKEKLLWIYGGQDYFNDDEDRKFYPQFYCHKFCWIQEDLVEQLKEIGFRNIVANENREFNQIIKAYK